MFPFTWHLCDNNFYETYTSLSITKDDQAPTYYQKEISRFKRISVDIPDNSLYLRQYWGLNVYMYRG